MSNYRYAINKIEKVTCLLVVSLITTVFTNPAIGKNANIMKINSDQYIESTIEATKLRDT